MIQDKFLDSYIEDVYSIGEEDNNIFLFRGDKTDNSHIKTNRKVQFIGKDKEKIKELLKNIASTDSIFVHWYDTWISDILYDLPNKINVMLWGGEFYCDPFWYHQWVYDKITLKELKNRLEYPKIKLTLNPFIFLKQIKSVLFFKLHLRKIYIQKNKSIGRIDNLICPIVNNKINADFIKIKQLYPDFRANNLAGFYDQNFDQALLNKRINPVNPIEIKVLLGNSADFSNNHLDAFDQLKQMKNIIIYCPLSYASDTDYVNFIIEKGKEIFKDRFVPITQFMGRDKYIEFLNSMDVILMYHNRQQAFGNICTGLSLGKPVFLKNNNSVKGYIDAMGIKIYDAENFSNINLLEVINEANANFEKNIEILKATISTEKRHSDLKKVLNN